MSDSTPRPGRCDCHCRRCGQHFANLESFDAHHSRDTADGPSTGCLDAEEIGMSFQEGICDISDAVTRMGLIWRTEAISTEAPVVFAEEEAA